MADSGGGPPQQRPVPPVLTLPPRSSFESLFTGGPGSGSGSGPGFSPGPITLVSNFFSDQYPAADVDFRSFSQLLAGAMASPVPQNSSVPLFGPNSSSEEADFEGYKQNRPMNLVIAQSPTGFMFSPSGFSPSGLLNSPSGFFSPLQSPFGMSHQQALAHVTAQAALSQSYLNNVQPEHQPSSLPSHDKEPQIPTETSDFDDSHVESPDHVSVSQSDIISSQHPASVSADTKPVSDGYNWRKYGHKQVKASECPRSYYKCSHANCPVKKIVGWSLDGQISSIVYKGQHNHEPPQLDKKEGADVKKPRNLQSETRRFEEPAAACDQISNGLIVNEEADDEPNPKRRNTNTEVGPMELTSSSHKVTESKIVVQTRSEVDLLDDGFKWRKYGQKVVKGNTNPRSYYKCTYTGCNVRKHVQRASSDPKSVVTTYEGKHNHDIPVPRHRSYVSNIDSAKPLSRKETKFENDQQSVVLHLKEEKIAA